VAGRVYVPQKSLTRFEVSESTLAALADPMTVADVPPAQRARVSGMLVAEVRRARALMRAGSPLVSLMPGRMRVAVAGFVGGGHAALDAVVSAGSSAVTTTPRPMPARVVRHLAVAMLTGGRS
jgi:phytoene/squalene synthetase